LKSAALEQGDDFSEVDVPMGATEVTRQPSSLGLAPGEVHEEYPAARPEDPPQFRCKLPTGSSAEVMKHDRAKRQIEARIRKRKRLRGSILEPDVHACPQRFRARPSQHFRGSVDAADCTRLANSLFREDCEPTCSAAYVQH
jgi:hypothetical protein